MASNRTSVSIKAFHHFIANTDKAYKVMTLQAWPIQSFKGNLHLKTIEDQTVKQMAVDSIQSGNKSNAVNRYKQRGWSDTKINQARAGKQAIFKKRLEIRQVQAGSGWFNASKNQSIDIVKICDILAKPIGQEFFLPELKLEAIP